jgi:hypothetical protein
MSFIEHTPTVESFPNQRIALGIASGDIVGATCEQIHGKTGSDSVENLQGLPKVLAFERQHHQKIYV